LNFQLNNILETVTDLTELSQNLGGATQVTQSTQEEQATAEEDSGEESRVSPLKRKVQEENPKDQVEVVEAPKKKKKFTVFIVSKQFVNTDLSLKGESS
jgi:hypothetical protein